VVSPLLANIALHGMEEVLGVKRAIRKGKEAESIGKRVVVRYADDFVVFCESKEDAEKSVEILKEWLAKRGLALSEEKTKIVHLTDGFDFLGFNIRHYKAPLTSKSGYKLLIKPSKKSVQKIREKLRTEWKALHGSNAQGVLKKLNPIIRGWANYFRIGVAKKTFNSLDSWMFRKELGYVRRMHPTKSFQWRQKRYWGKLNKQREDNWVFGDKLTGGYLLKFSWSPIERHELVIGKHSPDDPNLTEYWQKRRMAKARTLSPSLRRIAHDQNHVCRLCGMSLYNDEEIQKHHVKPRSKGGTNEYSNLTLTHLYCQQQIHSGQIKPTDADGESLLLLD